MRMEDAMWIDPETDKLMINPNADTIELPREVFEKMRDFITEEIDKEILERLKKGN